MIDCTCTCHSRKSLPNFDFSAGFPADSFELNSAIGWSLHFLDQILLLSPLISRSKTNPIAMEIYSFLSETIHAYTGLSLAAFITILSLMIGAYFLVSSLFVHPDSIAATEKSTVATTTPPAGQTPSTPPALLAQPVQMGEMTLEELKEYNGSDGNKPLLVSIKGDVYNVSRGWLFYGPGGAYHFFSGNEISRALALMSFDPSDFTDNLDGLGSNELEVLNDWEEKFKEKYVKVGHVVRRRENDTSEPESLTNDVEDVGADAVDE